MFIPKLQFYNLLRDRKKILFLSISTSSVQIFNDSWNGFENDSLKEHNLMLC